MQQSINAAHRINVFKFPTGNIGSVIHLGYIRDPYAKAFENMKVEHVASSEGRIDLRITGLDFTDYRFDRTMISDVNHAIGSYGTSQVVVLDVNMSSDEKFTQIRLGYVIEFSGDTALVRCDNVLSLDAAPPIYRDHIIRDMEYSINIVDHEAVLDMAVAAVREKLKELVAAKPMTPHGGLGTFVVEQRVNNEDDYKTVWVPVEIIYMNGTRASLPLPSNLLPMPGGNPIQVEVEF